MNPLRKVRGRGVMNISEWDKPQPDLGEVVEEINDGGMPPWQYTIIHSDADLSKADRAELVAALTRLYRQDPPPTGGG